MNKHTSIQERTTPKHIIESLKAFSTTGEIDLDPCYSPLGLTEPKKAYTENDNGLIQPWNTQGLIYVNPPYKDVQPWIKKGIAEIKRGTDIVYLVNACTDTRWWHLAISVGIPCFIKGRLKFGPVFKVVHMYPSVFLYMGFRKKAFREHFETMGWIP